MKTTKAIEGFCIDRIAEGYSQSTITSYKYSLLIFARYLGDPEIEIITVADLKHFFHHLRTDYKPNRSNGDTSPLSSASLHGKWKALRSLFNWASEVLDLYPIANEIPAPEYTSKEITPYTEQEIKNLLKACEYTAAASTTGRKRYRQRRPTALRDKAIILLFLDTGLRVGEVSRLSIKEVNLETGEVIVKPFGRGKKTSGRVVYIGRSTRRALWRYLADREDLSPQDPLFTTDHTKPMGGNAIKSLIRKMGKRAGVKAHPHKFRHTFAIQFLRNGGNIFALQKLLGHKTLDMVKRYLSIVEADAAKAHKKASPVDNWRL